MFRAWSDYHCIDYYLVHYSQLSELCKVFVANSKNYALTWNHNGFVHF